MASRLTLTAARALYFPRLRRAPVADVLRQDGARLSPESNPEVFGPQFPAALDRLQFMRPVGFLSQRFHSPAQFSSPRTPSEMIPCSPTSDPFVTTPAAGALSAGSECNCFMDNCARSICSQRSQLIPLAALTTMTSPPPSRVETFYDESERLVRFLASTDKASFLTFLDAVARHQPIDSALVQSYNGKFLTLAALEEQFRAYATKEFGTSLQQAEAK